MADYGGAISLSQGGQGLNFSAQTSSSDNDDDSGHTPKSMATFSGGACGGRSSSSSKLVKLEPVITTSHRSSMELLGGRGSPSSTEEIMMISNSKKPRGRPPGSKNKPRPPIVINKESESGMKSVVIEISAGSDVVESLVQYARTRHVGISVLSGCGSVSNVTLRRPLSHHHHHAPAPFLSLHGPFNLLSLSGSFMESLSSCSFGICLAGSQGQVFGGIVGDKVIAASLVVVVAAIFLKPRFHKLPAEGGCDDEQETKPCTLGGGYANASTSNTVGNHQETSTTTSCGFGGGGGGTAAAAACVYGTPPPISHTHHHDQMAVMLMPWGGPPSSRPPLPPPQ